MEKTGRKERIGIAGESPGRKAFSYIFGLIVIVLGLLLNALGVKGNDAPSGLGGVGNWLIMVGIIAIFAATLHAFGILGKRKQVDERVEFISARASRFAFMVFLLIAFAIPVADAIHPLTASYFQVMSGLICGMVIAYALAYKALERRY